MSFALFTSKNSALIGVDLGSSAIKMVELSSSKNGLRLEKFAMEPLAAGVVSDGTVTNSDELTQAISRCHAKMQTKTKSVAIGLSAESVFIKRLTIAAGLSESETEEEIAGQLSSLMSIDPDEINIDFQLMTPSTGQADDSGESSTAQQSSVLDPDKQEVIAMASKREKVDDRVSSIEGACLKVLVVDSEILAMHTVLDEMFSRDGKSLQDENHALVNVDENVMTLVVMRNGEAIYTRDAAFGLGQLISDIVMRYGVDEEIAKQIISGDLDAPEGFEAIQRNHVESAVQEIQRSMQLFMTSTSYIGVECVHLHGQGATMDGLDAGIAQALCIPCEVLNPFKGLEISKSVDSDSLDLHACSLVVACGLAFRRFDL